MTSQLENAAVLLLGALYFLETDETLAEDRDNRSETLGDDPVYNALERATCLLLTGLWAEAGSGVDQIVTLASTPEEADHWRGLIERWFEAKQAKSA